MDMQRILVVCEIWVFWSSFRRYAKHYYLDALPNFVRDGMEEAITRGILPLTLSSVLLLALLLFVVFMDSCDNVSCCIFLPQTEEQRKKQIEKELNQIVADGEKRRQEEAARKPDEESKPIVTKKDSDGDILV